MQSRAARTVGHVSNLMVDGLNNARMVMKTQGAALETEGRSRGADPNLLVLADEQSLFVNIGA